MISVNELAMSLQNHNLWLNPSDSDWHRPLQATLRAFTQKNAKFSGQMSEKQKQNQAKYAPKRQKSTAYTGPERTETESEPVPWKTREHATWQRYEDKAWKEWSWETPPTKNSASSSSSTGQGWQPTLEASKAPWRSEQKQDEESENLTWAKSRY